MVILSNETFHILDANSMEEKSGYCIEELEEDERIPVHWVEGWMSDIYPIRVIRKC